MEYLSYLWPIIAGVACAYLNRVRGAGEAEYPNWPEAKTTSILLMAVVCLPPMAGAYLRHYDGFDGVFAIIGTMFVASLQLLFRPSWGEIFPHTKDTYQNDYAWGVRPMTRFLTGYAYTANIAKDDLSEVVWKTVAWVSRFTIYALPALACVCCATESLLPIILWPFLSVWVGLSYLRPHLDGDDGDKVAVGERYSGFFVGFFISVLCLI